MRIPGNVQERRLNPAYLPLTIASNVAGKFSPMTDSARSVETVFGDKRRRTEGALVYACLTGIR
jgi:hypothetical protein